MLQIADDPMTLTGEVEIDSVRTARWIVGSNPLGGSPDKFAGYVVHMACPKFVCKYTMDKNKDDDFYWLNFDDGERAPVKSSGMHYVSPRFEDCTLTIFDVIWIDSKPASTEEEEKLLGAIHGVIEAFLLDNPAHKAEFIRNWNGE